MDSTIYWGDFPIGEVGKATVAPGELLRLAVPTCCYVLAPMPGGDVVFAGVPGIVGIERKAGTDFTSSYSSGHLAEQLAVMLSCYDEVVLVIENDHLPVLCANRGLDYDVVAQDIISYQAAGIRVIYSSSRPHTGRLVDSLFAYYQRPLHGALVRRHVDRSLALYERVLTAIPGWGKATAHAALQTLGTPFAVFNAPDDVLLPIRGVTRRATANLRAALGGKHNAP